MIIETNRLQLVPLTPGNINLWISDIKKLEEELNCKYMAEPMEGLFKEIVKGQAKITNEDPENYLWHSFWFLIRKNDRVVVGSLDFKDVPNSMGEVEIGYGLGKAFEKNGYMTEAVKGMCDWAFNNDNVKYIIAETDADGYASQRILKRCGFKPYRSGETLWWRLEEVCFENKC
jgi:predicted acetyltransferase